MSITPFQVRVPATSANLGPGFDCMGLALTFGASFTVDLARDEFPHYRIEDQDLGDDRNLFQEAAERLASQVGKRLPILDVRVQSEIPLRRGLGSSASAVVAGLLAANQLFDQPLDLPALLNLATQIEGHPDNVAPALYGGMTLAVQGERGIHCESLPLALPLEWVVAVPDFDVPTSEARAVLPGVVPLEDAVYNVGRAALLVAALMRGSSKALREALSDRLHEPYRQTLVPGMMEVSRSAREAGAWGVTLSGAGPALLAWGPTDRLEFIAKVIQSEWSRSGIACRTMRTAIASQGASVKERALRETPWP